MTGLRLGHDPGRGKPGVSRTGAPAPTYSREAPGPGAGTARRDAVKYILLIYNNPAMLQSFSKEELDGVFGDVDALMTELRQSGEWIGGEGLAAPPGTCSLI